MSQAVLAHMKYLPFSWPELVFITLIMFLPWLVAAHWSDGSGGSFVGWLLLSALVGFGLWVAVILLAARCFDRNQRK